MLTATQRQQRARFAALRRHRGADDPEADRLAAEFKADRLADYIRRTVDAAPPLTAEQRDRLALLLRGGGGVDAA